MRLATLRDGSPDGALAVIASDGARCIAANTSLIAAIADWTRMEPALRELAARVEADGQLFDRANLAAPLPRSWQWLDGSAFPTHGELMQKAFNLPPIETSLPLMYQGMSDRFYGPHDRIPFVAESDFIDFEGEFGVITDAVPMGVSAEQAMDHVKLLVLINDWSLRAIAPIEMKTGFGWVQAKPACSVAPFAVTPDALGEAWADGRVHLKLEVKINGVWFGHPHGREMAFGFHDLIAHAARTRDLVAGTIIGSGTVSNRDHASVGSSCISERRAIEMIAHGSAKTAFLRFGDRVAMRASASESASPFGEIDQSVVAA